MTGYRFPEGGNNLAGLLLPGPIDGPIQDLLEKGVESITPRQERSLIQKTLGTRVEEGASLEEISGFQGTLTVLDKQLAVASRRRYNLKQEDVRKANAELEEDRRACAIDALISHLSSSDGLMYSTVSGLDDRDGIMEFGLIDYKRGVLKVSYSTKSRGALTISPQWTSIEGTRIPIRYSRHRGSNRIVEMTVRVHELESRLPIIIEELTEMYEEITTIVRRRKRNMAVTGTVDTGTYKVEGDITPTPDINIGGKGVPQGYTITREEGQAIARRLMD